MSVRPKKDINVRIGLNIQAAREHAGYTQEALSELIGVTPNHLSAIERGASGASLETIERLCNIFGVSADFLLFGKSQADDFTDEIAAQLSHIKPEYRPQIRKVIAALLEVTTLHETNQE